MHISSGLSSELMVLLLCIRLKLISLNGFTRRGVKMGSIVSDTHVIYC